MRVPALAGGALPVAGGLVIYERFDRILNLDEKNFQVTVEPGMITENLQNTLKERVVYRPTLPAGAGILSAATSTPA